ncbi:MAG: adenylate/guanylate cyclase domain-containing protein, partial [Halioglobus sp.]
PDSTVIAETIGDVRWSAAVKSHVETVNQILVEHQGVLIKSLGDGTMSSFSSARTALLTAVALQRAMEEESSEPQLQIRVGLHTGDLIEQDGDMFGTVVNKAARIAAVAHPDEIRLSDATKIMVGKADFTFSDPVTTTLKGLDGEHALYRLEWKA